MFPLSLCRLFAVQEFLPGPRPDPKVQRRLMKHITKVICEQTGFILEEKLRTILSPMINTERNLIHIDAVLHVKNAFASFLSL